MPASDRNIYTIISYEAFIQECIMISMKWHRRKKEQMREIEHTGEKEHRNDGKDEKKMRDNEGREEKGINRSERERMTGRRNGERSRK